MRLHPAAFAITCSPTLYHNPSFSYVDAPSVKMARIFCDFIMRKKQVVPKYFTLRTPCLAIGTASFDRLPPAPHQVPLPTEDRRIFLGMAAGVVVMVIVGAIPPNGGYAGGFGCPFYRGAPY